jgi:hypothetical protein
MTLLAELEFPAGSQDAETSVDAAANLDAEELTRRRLKVLRCFAVAGRSGRTADEVVAILNGPANSWAPRVTELLQAGLIDRLDGKDGRGYLRRRTRSGGTAFVHVISARGTTISEQT